MNTLTFAEAVAACAAGKKVEYSYDGGNTWYHQPARDWWNSSIEIYRLAESPIAEGHNPEQLTEEVVGVADGERLLTEEESTPSRLVPETEWWNDGCWHSLPPGDSGWWCGPDVTLRTKKPPGYFLPKPKRRVLCGPADFPPGTVVRLKGDKGGWKSVTGVNEDGIYIYAHFWPWNSLNDATRSIDGGRTWLPCCKDAEE